MKQIQIGIVINEEGKLAIAKKTKGFEKNIYSEFEILGILQTIVSVQQEKIKTLQSNVKQT